MSTRPAAGMRRPIRSDKGQALPEFALVLPILVLAFFGIIEFGRFAFAYEVLNNAVREGARYAIVHGADSLCPTGPMPGGGLSLICPDTEPYGEAVQNRVIGYAFALGLRPDQVTVTWPDLSNARGNDVMVTVAYSFKPIIPLPLPEIGMTARSSLVINH